jgi:glyoxylase-like metal-dependent hydrolase (beta-lactamase superfamily II)
MLQRKLDQVVESCVNQVGVELNTASAPLLSRVAGIGPRLAFDESKTIGLLVPTKTFSEDRFSLEISGLKLTLVHAPGETPDQIVIWMPDKKVLLPADNYY